MFYYCVKKGYTPGIYNTWNECKKQIDGFSGASFKKFTSVQEAHDFMDINNKKDEAIQNNCIYVDGGYNKFSKPFAFGSVVDCNGHDLIASHDFLLQDMLLKDVELPVGPRKIIMVKFTDVTSQQNNGAELLAMIAGLRIMIYNKFIGSILSDSSLMVDHWSLQIKNTHQMDSHKVAYIHELIYLRKFYENMGGSIVKISGDHNKGDLGFHKSK